MESENHLFTTTEAATYLSITRSYLYKLMMWRKVPYYKPRGKLCFFDKADLDEYNHRYRVQSEDELEAQSEAYMLRKRIQDGLLIAQQKSCSSEQLCFTKTSKQDIHDLLAAITNDVEEIKAQLGGTAGTTVSADIAADAGAASKYNAICNNVVVSNGSAAYNPDYIIAEINRLLEPIAGVCCSKLPDQIKSYYAQLLLHIPKDLREGLTRDNDTRKRKGQPMVEDKIDNSLTLLISVYDRLNQLEDAILYDTHQRAIDTRARLSRNLYTQGKWSCNNRSQEVRKAGNYSVTSICVVADATIPLKATYAPV